MTYVSSFINEDAKADAKENTAVNITPLVEPFVEPIVDQIVDQANKEVVTVINTPVIENTFESKINENSLNNSKDIPKIVPVDAWRFMVSIIDDMSSLYTDNMWRDAIDSMKQKLIVFMTSGTGHKKYGPKKSRTILAWLTDNKRGTPARAETATVIAAFISWLLDVNVSSLESSNYQWYMFRKRGMWMIKDNHSL
jgi:hypothetical protein